MTYGLAARPRGNGRSPTLDDAMLALVARFVRERNDVTVAELCDLIERARGVRVSALGA